MILETPKASPDCDVCGEDERKLLRCSRCQNHFYCSTACQKKHWKEHKFDCSPLPQGDIEPWKVPNMEELTAEYEWATNWVDQVLKVLGNDPNTGKDVGTEYDEAEHKRLSLELRDRELPPSLAYTFVNPPMPNATKTSTNWTLISRTYLLHTLATCSPEFIAEETALGRPNGGMNAPGTWTQLHMPKIQACADRLSLAEYAALIQLMAIGETNQSGRAARKSKEAGEKKVENVEKEVMKDEVDDEKIEKEAEEQGEEDGETEEAEEEAGTREDVGQGEGHTNGPWMRLLILQGALKTRNSKKKP